MSGPASHAGACDARRGEDQGEALMDRHRPVVRAICRRVPDDGTRHVACNLGTDPLGCAILLLGASPLFDESLETAFRAIAAFPGYISCLGTYPC